MGRVLAGGVGRGDGNGGVGEVISWGTGGH